VKGFDSAGQEVPDFTSGCEVI